MNASARVTMKDAANCDKQCELQNSVNHQDFERTLRFRAFLEACLAQSLYHLLCPLWSRTFFQRCAPVHQCARVLLSSESGDAPLTHEKNFETMRGPIFLALDLGYPQHLLSRVDIAYAALHCAVTSFSTLSFLCCACWLNERKYRVHLDSRVGLCYCNYSLFFILGHELGKITR